MSNTTSSSSSAIQGAQHDSGDLSRSKTPTIHHEHEDQHHADADNDQHGTSEVPSVNQAAQQEVIDQVAWLTMQMQQLQAQGAVINPLPPPRPIAQPIQERVQQAAAQQGASQQMHQQPAAPLVSAALPIRIRELKLPEPRPYLGTKDKSSIRVWMRDIEEIFTMGSIPLDQPLAIDYAAYYLREDAKTFYIANKVNMPTWQIFKHHMITRYKDPREVDKARVRLSSIRQINTVEAYTPAFDRALLEFIEVAGYQPIAADTLFMYREGLKPQVKTFVAARGTINDLKELQAIALEIDASLYNTHGISNNTNTFRPSHHKHDDYHGGNNNYNSGNRYRPQPSSFNRDNFNNRFQSSNRFNQQRPAPSFNRPQQFNREASFNQS